MISAALIGSLTKDADRRQSKADKPFVILNVAAGDEQYVSVLVFGAAVDAVAELPKGAKVFVEGSISLSTWTTSDGTARAGLKVVSFNAAPIHADVSRHRRRQARTRTAGAATLPMARNSSTPTAPAAVDPDLNDEIPW